MSGPALPDPSSELKKRRREKILMALTLGLLVSLTSVEIYLVRRGGHPITGSLLAFGLLNVNAILFLLLTFLIFRHLTKLFLERRRKVFGSRLRIRLVLTFISLALLPTLFMFFIAWQLIGTRVDYQWDRKVEETLEQTLALSSTFTQGLADKLRALGHLCRQGLSAHGLYLADPQTVSEYLSQQEKSYQVHGLEIIQANGKVWAAGQEARNARWPEVLPEPKGEGWPESLQQQVLPGGLLLTFVLPLNISPNPESRPSNPTFRIKLGAQQSAGEAAPRYLVVRQLIPRPYLAQLTEAQRQVQVLRRTEMLFRPVRISHYLTLVGVTLLTLMAAIWLAFYMAREITTPIRQLAEGTSKVAGGDYSFQIDQEGKDEIGFLVQSFNKMTLELQHSRAQLASAYEQLRESHTSLAASKRSVEILLQNVAAGVIGIDAAGRITTINDSAARMLRLQKGEVLGQDARVLLPPGDYQRLAEVLAEARRTKGTVERPLHLNFPDATLCLLLKATVLKDEGGGDLGVVMVFEDLTELERAQRQNAWREVARRIAHEVKNPLTPIKLAAQRLRRRYLASFGEDGQVFDECTQIISDQVDEIKNLVNEFSRFARLPHLSLTTQDLNVLIQETLLLYQSVQPRVTLEFQPDPTLSPLLLDREQIKRLLLNLVDNALASTPEGGTISLSVKGEPEKEQVRLEVADTGQGIPDRDKTRVFEPYFSTKRGGTGLGLAIVHSIVSEHNGHIRVEDNHPHGARFIIELPLRRG